MKRELWYLRKDEPVIFPEDLRRDPNKYGGLGMHMLMAINDGVITIPLIDTAIGVGSCVSVQVTNEATARRIVADGGVDILANGYWTNITNQKVVFRGTDEDVRTWQGGFFKTLGGTAS